MTSTALFPASVVVPRAVPAASVPAGAAGPSAPFSASDAPVDPHRPLVETEALVARVRHLLPTAVRRQLWTLFLDTDGVQLPMMVPLEGIPAAPEPAGVDAYGEALDAVAAEFGVASVVFVVERPGPGRTTASDRLWCEAVAGLGAGRRFAVRAVLTCADDGVRLVVDAGRHGPDLGDGPEPPTKDRAQASPRRLVLSDALSVR